MKGKNFTKKLAACLLFGLLLAAMAVPVSAATYSKKTEKTISKGQSYHVMNNNISKNKVKKCTVTITANSGSKYDLALAGNGVEIAVKGCTSRKEVVALSGKNLSYVKSSAGSNKGMILCLRVTKGKVKVKLNYTTGYKSGKLTFTKQKKSHQPLKSVTVKKNHRVLLNQKGGNISFVPLIMSGKGGTTIRRALDGTIGGTYDYEIFTFGSKSLAYKYYKNKVKVQGYNWPSSMKVNSNSWMVPLMGRYSGWMTTTKGTATYYYPSDYLKIAVSKK